MHRFTAKFIPLLLLTCSAVTALPTPIAGSDVISVPGALSADIRKDVIHASGTADEQSEDKDENVEVEGIPEPEPEQSNNKKVGSEVTEVGCGENDKEVQPVEEKMETEDKDKDKGKDNNKEVKVEEEIEDNSCENESENKGEPEINSDVEAGGRNGGKCVEAKVEVEVKDNDESCGEVNTKCCDDSTKDSDDGTESCSDGKVEDVCEQNCNKNQFEVEVKIENDNHFCEVEIQDSDSDSGKDNRLCKVHSECDKLDDCDDKHSKYMHPISEIISQANDISIYRDSHDVGCVDENRVDSNISISSSTCNHSGPNGIQYNNNYNYSCNTHTPQPQHHSPESHDGTTRQHNSPDFHHEAQEFDEFGQEAKAMVPHTLNSTPPIGIGHFDYSGSVALPQKPDNQVTSKTQEAKIDKRSAEPKRLPSHLVMYKHMKLAETSPHLLGVKSTEELSEIWAKNLPYPLDGNPTIPGRGHIDKRSTGSESRIVEQRQKENVLREVFGKHPKPTSRRLDPERNTDLEQCREDRNTLTKELGIDYKLKVGQSEQEKVPQSLEKNEQQKIPCGSQRCRDNTERNRDKEQMRVGDAGLLAQLFQPQQS